MDRPRPLIQANSGSGSVAAVLVLVISCSAPRRLLAALELGRAVLIPGFR
ncbi:hypothetical protein [Amycolatopsis sp. cmx-4-83]